MACENGDMPLRAVPNRCTGALRVGINGQPLQAGRSGVGRFAFELCRSLDECLPDAQFFVYSQTHVEMPLCSDRWTLRLDPSPWAKYIKPVLWLKLRCGRLCRKDDLDVFWGTTTFLPGVSSNVRKVTTVYDLNYRVAPQTMTMAFLWANRLLFRRDVCRADTVLAISEGTSNRLRELLGRRAEGITRPAVDETFRPQPEPKIRECLEEYGIQRPYILAVATWEPRKNLELLVHTFLEMKRQGLLAHHRLVLVGGRGWKDRRLAARVGGQGRDHIAALGYVPQQMLPGLYAGADVFVFPSIYEGFGMPVLEARACGTVAVTSDIPELREAGGTDAIYIEPTEQGIRNGILTALETLPSTRIEKPNLATWRQSARILAAALAGTL